MTGVKLKSKNECVDAIMSVSVAVREKPRSHFVCPALSPFCGVFYLVTVYNVEGKPAFVSDFTAILYRRTGCARKMRKHAE